MKSVVFCSSQRFRKDLMAFITRLKAEAKKQKLHLVVFQPEFEERSHEFENASEKERLKDPHYTATVAGKIYDHLFRKVKVADVCYVFNKDGYLGANTTGELFAAAITGKICYSHHPQMLMGTYPYDLYEEPAAQHLIHEVIRTPAELLKRLL